MPKKGINVLLRVQDLETTLKVKVKKSFEMQKAKKK